MHSTFLDNDSQGHVDVDASPDVDAVEDQPVVAEDGRDPAEGHGQYPPPECSVDQLVKFGEDFYSHLDQSSLANFVKFNEIQLKFEL